MERTGERERERQSERSERELKWGKKDSLRQTLKEISSPCLTVNGNGTARQMMGQFYTRSIDVQ